MELWSVQILVVVANIQVRENNIQTNVDAMWNLKTEVEKGSIKTVIEYGWVDPKW